jgi:hypothetical protein
MMHVCKINQAYGFVPLRVKMLLVLHNEYQDIIVLENVSQMSISLGGWFLYYLEKVTIAKINLQGPLSLWL